MGGGGGGGGEGGDGGHGMSRALLLAKRKLRDLYLRVRQEECGMRHMIV